jgi:hypothetical protein
MSKQNETGNGIIIFFLGNEQNEWLTTATGRESENPNAPSQSNLRVHIVHLSEVQAEQL